MSLRVIETANSLKDLRRILDYFVDQNEPNVGARFIDAYEETLAWIGDFPELGSPWETDAARLQNVRVKPIHGFEKYLLFYRLREQGAYILRIFHGHQDIANLL